jgi:SAM-dependent methyltransferase
MDTVDIKESVKQRYGQAALRVRDGQAASCGGSASRSACCEPSSLYGLDMTDELLDLARENQRKAGMANVEFLKGEMEDIPLPDLSVDIVISNCVINLSADKGRVLTEAFRVLRPGGRLAVSDIVVRGEVPSEIRRNVELWMGCVAGALEESDYRAKLAAAGFTDIEIEPTRVYKAEDARDFLASAGIALERFAEQVDGKFMSAFVRARKPDTAKL